MTVGDQELTRVIEFLTQHSGGPSLVIDKPLKSTDLRKVVPEWAARFVELDKAALFRLLLAANYMGIEELVELTCAKVASLIKGKTTEQIGELFGVKKDFTEAEHRAVLAENSWANVE